MPISNCPKCEAEVLLPASTDAAARVKCPLCDEEYTLGDVLEKLPPALILLDVPALAETSAASGEFGSMFGGDESAGGFSFDADGPDLQLEGDDDSSGVSFGGEEGAAATATLTTSPRKQKPKKSIAKELVKIVLGGVGGLVIAYGILLWGFGRDPLPIAPDLPPQMLWIIPKDLRAEVENPKPKKKTNDEKQTSKQTNTDDGNGGPEPTTDFVAPESDDDIENKFNGISTPESDEPESDVPVAPDDTPPALDEPGDDLPDADLPGDDLTTPKFDPFDSPDNSDDPADLPTFDTPPADPTTDPLPVEPEPTEPEDETPKAPAPGLKTAEPISEKDLNLAWDQADSAIKKLSPENPADRATLTSEKFKAYNSLCELAWARTRAQSGLSDSALSPQAGGLGKAVTAMDAMFAEIAFDPTQAKVLGQMANVALTRNATKNGMILTGMVGEISQAGDLHQISVVLPAFEPQIKLQVITVLSRDLPELKLKDQILVIGAVIKNPADEITGFKGKNEQVIWAAGLERLGSTATPAPSTSEE